MHAALKYFRQAHLDYLWLHILAALVLIYTSVFWFIVPYFIVSYGNYTITAFQQVAAIALLYIAPSFILTLHCWFINFKAAINWKQSHPNESFCYWLLRFQFRTIIIVMVFTSLIYTSLFVIDMLR